MLLRTLIKIQFTLPNTTKNEWTPNIQNKMGLFKKALNVYKGTPCL